MNRILHLSAALLLPLSNALAATQPLDSLDPSSGIIARIDSEMDKLYQNKNIIYTDDTTMLGKFQRFCDEQEYDSATVFEELKEERASTSELVDFDEDYGLAGEIKNEKLKWEKIWKILRQCAGLETIQNDADDEKEEEPSSNKNVPYKRYIPLTHLTQLAKSSSNKGFERALFRVFWSVMPYDTHIPATNSNLLFCLFFDRNVKLCEFSYLFFVVFDFLKKNVAFRTLSYSKFVKNTGVSSEEIDDSSIHATSQTEYNVSFFLSSGKFATMKVDIRPEIKIEFMKAKDINKKNYAQPMHHFNSGSGYLYTVRESEVNSKFVFSVSERSNPNKLIVSFEKNTELGGYQFQRLFGYFCEKTNRHIFIFLLMDKEGDLYLLKEMDSPHSKGKNTFSLGIGKDNFLPCLRILLMKDWKEKIREYSMECGVVSKHVIPTEQKQIQLPYIHRVDPKNSAKGFLLGINTYNTFPKLSLDPDLDLLYFTESPSYGCQVLSKKKLLIKTRLTVFYLIDFALSKYIKLEEKDFDSQWRDTCKNKLHLNLNRSPALNLLDYKSDKKNLLLYFQIVCCLRKSDPSLSGTYKDHYTSYCWLTINMKKHGKDLHTKNVSIDNKVKEVYSIKQEPTLAEKINAMVTRQETYAMNSDNETDDDVDYQASSQ